jgi:hypothetical protein
MRTFDEAGKETLVRELGPVPNIKDVVTKITRTFNLEDEMTRTSERVFLNTFRLVAQNDAMQKYFGTPQKHVVAPRKKALTIIAQPTVDWLQTLYPDCTPVLVQVATLPVGAELLWHVDCYLYQSRSHKVHIPIRTNPGVLYQTQDLYDDDKPHDFHFEVGNAYEINNIMMHRAINKGDCPRSHLIVDMMETAAIEEWEAQNIDFFFTHHKENKLLEVEATLRAGRRSLK